MAETYNLEVLLRARSEGMGALKEAETALGGIAKAGLVVGAVLAGAVVVGAVEAVKAAGKFQASMELIRTQAGASQKEVDSMSKSVLALAGQVATAPEILADALYHLESTGFRGATALEALRVSAEGAKVGQSNLVDVTNALDAVLVAGVPEANNMTEAMGQLNAVVGAGDMKMQDLADAMGTGILATAKTFGLGLRDVGAALAVLGDNNIRGAEGATKLRMEISLLGAPVAHAREELLKIGIKTDELANKMRSGGLIAALQDLHDHLVKSGKSATQQADVIAAAFGGGKSAGTIELLLNQLDRLKSKYQEVGEGAARFGDAWATTQGNLNFKIDAMKAAAEAAGIKVGLVLLPYVSQLLDKLTPLVPVVADWAEKMVKKLVPAVKDLYDKLVDLKPYIQGVVDKWPLIAPFVLAWVAAQVQLNAALLIAQGLAIWAIIGPYVSIVLAARSATELWAAAQLLLDAAMDANPVGLVVLAISALVIGVIWAYQNVGWFRFAVDALWGALKAFVSQFWTDVKPVLDWLGPIFHTIGDAVGAFKDQFWADIKPIFDWLGPVLQDAVNWLGLLAQALGLAANNSPGAANYSAAAHARTFASPRGAGSAHAIGAAGGFEGTVYRPTLFLAGEGGAPEDVRIGPKGSGGGADMTAVIRELRALRAAVTAEPSGQDFVAANLYKATQGAGLNRLRGMAGA